MWRNCGPTLYSEIRHCIVHAGTRRSRIRNPIWPCAPRKSQLHQLKTGSPLRIRVKWESMQLQMFCIDVEIKRNMFDYCHHRKMYSAWMSISCRVQTAFINFIISTSVIFFRSRIFYVFFLFLTVLCCLYPSIFLSKDLILEAHSFPVGSDFNSISFAKNKGKAKLVSIFLIYFYLM